MTTTTQQRDWRAEVMWRISGQARLDRFVRERHLELHMTLSGFLLSCVMLWQGVILLPGGPDAVAPFNDVLMRVAPVENWGWFAILVGLMQITGTLLAWTGFVPPVKQIRLVTSGATCFYFSAIAAALLFGGYAFGPAMYMLVAVPLSVRDLSEASRMR